MASETKTLRSEACSQYHRDVNRSEVSVYLNCDDWRRWRTDWCLPGQGLQVHHIFGRGSPEHEHRSNLIMVSACAHAWGHDSHPNEFRMACLYAKWDKRLICDVFLGLPGLRHDSVKEFDVREFDVPTLEKLAGVPLVDWLEVQGQKVDGIYREYAEEMIRWASKSVAHQPHG